MKKREVKKKVERKGAKKTFGDLLGGAWNEYKANFGTLFVIVLLLSVIPAIVLSFYQPTQEAIEADPMVAFSAPFLIILLVIIILGVIMGASLIYLAVNNKKGKMGFGEAVKGGLGYFWKYLGLSIVMMFFLMLLFLLLVIPGIIFMIYWLFAFYVLVAEDKGIMASLSRSKELVKGRWWGVFGYSLLFFLIIIGISFAFSIPSGILGVGLASTIIMQIATIIITPLSVLFYKNFYKDLAGKK